MGESQFQFRRGDTHCGTLFKYVLCGYTVKKGYRFSLPPARMSLTKLSLAGNNLIVPGHGDIDNDIPAGEGKYDRLFLQCS
jgi:hypothetical protein